MAQVYKRGKTWTVSFSKRYTIYDSGHKSYLYIIDVPFLDSFSDEITMYATRNKDNTITLTDDGWTLDNLESNGVSISRSKNRKKILANRLNAFGINEKDGELTTTVEYKNFPLAKNRLLQAILAVNDMFILSKK